MFEKGGQLLRLSSGLVDRERNVVFDRNLGLRFERLEEGQIVGV